VILVSLDGFRWDYPDRGVTPSLERLIAEGVRAVALVPSFTTKTFPNHYTLVTGLYPDHHGIVANNFWDPVIGERFSVYDRDKVRDARWWGGEPVWLAAERAGLTTAPMFWPGSEAPIGGLHASHWLPYDGTMFNDSRVDWVLSLLDLPLDQRPVFLTLYFSDADDAGHAKGPDSDAMDLAIQEVDQAVGRLLAGIDARDLWNLVNIIVVSDHGMIPVREDQVVFLDDYIDLSTVDVADWNPVAAVWPGPGDEESVYEALSAAHPRMKVYRRGEFPAHLHYGTSQRVAPVTAVADPGWSITSRSYFNETPERFSGGSHGFDSAAGDMHGIFIAAGPAFRPGMRTEAIENIHVYSLIMEILGLPPAPSDGSLEAVGQMLSW
jgi:predicted AlkP superfamily pyrophosphatase or phosphodiesterase